MELFGTNLGVFIGVTIVLFGAAGFMTGQALAQTWRPEWHLVPYSLLMAAGDRFFDWSLFGGGLLSLPGYLLAAAIVLVISVMSYRATRARKMVLQYPWLYERAGLFAWRDRQG